MFNFTRALDRNADGWPDREAVVFEDRRLTNAALADRVNSLAAGFAELGVGRDDVVALLLYNGTEFLETTLAVNKVGGVFMPLNYRLAPPEWAYILNHAGAKAIVTEPEFVTGLEAINGDLPKLGATILVGGRGRSELGFEDLINAHAGARIATVDRGPDDIQRLMYTSGTTSRPKGVPLSHGNVLWKIFGHIVELGLTAHDRTLMAGPMYHVGAFDLPGMGCLYVGGSLVIMRKFDAHAMMSCVQVEKPTNVWLAPAMLNAILQLPDLDRFDTGSVRFITNGGEKMPVSIIEKVLSTFPNAWLADSYGLTETASGDTLLDQEHTIAKLGSVGKPSAHLAIRIVRKDGSDAASDELGEIWLKGPKVFTGYWKDAEATAAAFADGWFKTGDVGRLDDDGYLYIEDRRKDMIVSGGENIATPEIERVLYQHPAVLEAAVTGVPDARWGEVPKAFVVLRPGYSTGGGDLIAYCAAELAKFKVPKTVEFTDSLPRTPSGKVLKRELRQRANPTT